MKFLSLIVLCFIGIPAIELVLLLWIHRQTSWQFTLGLVILTGLLGSYLCRQAGLAQFRKIKAALRAGRIPSIEVVSGLLVLASGLLLITPGVLTDTIGFLLLLSPLRDRIAAIIVRMLKQRFQGKVTFFRDNFPNP